MNQTDFKFCHDPFLQRLTAFVDFFRANGVALESLGLSKQTLSNYRRRKSLPSGQTLASWAHMFDLDVHWLLTGEGRMLRGDTSPQMPSQDSLLREMKTEIAYLKELLDAKNNIIEDKKRLIEYLEDNKKETSPHIPDTMGNPPLR